MNKGGCKTGRKQEPKGGCKVGKKNPETRGKTIDRPKKKIEKPKPKKVVAKPKMIIKITSKSDPANKAMGAIKSKAKNRIQEKVKKLGSEQVKKKQEQGEALLGKVGRERLKAKQSKPLRTIEPKAHGGKLGRLIERLKNLEQYNQIDREYSALKPGNTSVSHNFLVPRHELLDMDEKDWKFESRYGGGPRYIHYYSKKHKQWRGV